MTLVAGVCPNGHVSYPTHPRCPDCGEPQEETLDLSERTAEVVTWTTSTATPPGVRQPNTMAIVEFDLSDEGLTDDFVRALGQVTTEDVETGDEVEPVYVEELRDPDVGIKEPESQDWDGYRWDPV
ncbi:Zn-ribbon domain-containing OB-fold protein [Halomicroarcula sp. GCM10025324]|uniref:Zn-ribbon domain-containing OB-fold protein n=1 Tax=Haloarcula TaxID=2237 RepID=UPI0023E7FED0|nr:nucleic acid-binding protein [Halomicroarcula sp. ZS-22-S1]